MSNQIQLRERASYSYCARSWRQQTNPSRKKFPSGWKCYKTLGSYVMCAFIRHVCVHRDMKHLGSLESTQEPMNQLLNEHVTKPDMQWYSKLTHPVYRVDSNSGLLCFFFTSFVMGPEKLAPLSQPIRCKTKDLVARVFPRVRQFGYFF